MLTFISFLLVLLGCVNWLMIGLLQYDFVAGMFGYQGSIFSRIIYIIVGIAALYIVFKTVAGKGKLNILNFSFKKKIINDKEKMVLTDYENSPLSKIINKQSTSEISSKDFEQNQPEERKNNISENFDNKPRNEHLNNLESDTDISQHNIFDDLDK